MHSLPVRVHPAVSTVVAAALGLAGGCTGDEPPDLGEATEAVHSPHLGDPLPGLDPDLLDLFFVGEAEFERDLTVADGLGPLFIESSCVACHALGGVGGADRGLDENHLVTRLPPGEVLQTRAIAELGSPCAITPEELPAGTPIAARNSLQTFGVGLIDHLAVSTIDDYVRAIPERGVRGKLGVGRFGWKAQAGTLTGFTAAAANGTMSLTTGAANEQTRFGASPASIDPACSNAALGATTPNDSGHFLRTVVAWQALLAPPGRRPSAAAERGEEVFTDAGCALCHRPSMTTRDQDYLLVLPDGSTRPVPQLRNQTAALWSDLLLHDMGPEAAELIVMGNATPSELRTPPLWGVGHRTRFLHDGRARTLDEAIEAHGGEAAEVREAYRALPPKLRQELLAFLKSL